MPCNSALRQPERPTGLHILTERLLQHTRNKHAQTHILANSRGQYRQEMNGGWIDETACNSQQMPHNASAQRMEMEDFISMAVCAVSNGTDERNLYGVIADRWSLHNFENFDKELFSVLYIYPMGTNRIGLRHKLGTLGTIITRPADTVPQVMKGQRGERFFRSSRCGVRDEHIPHTQRPQYAGRPLTPGQKKPSLPGAAHKSTSLSFCLLHIYTALHVARCQVVHAAVQTQGAVIRVWVIQDTWAAPRTLLGSLFAEHQLAECV